MCEIFVVEDKTRRRTKCFGSKIVGLTTGWPHWFRHSQIREVRMTNVDRNSYEIVTSFRYFSNDFYGLTKDKRSEEYSRNSNQTRK